MADRESFRNIEMPPLDEIQNVTAALANDRAPVLEAAPKIAQPTAELDADGFPTTTLDALPNYDSDYNPQAVDLPDYEAPAEPDLSQQVQAVHPNYDHQKAEEEKIQARNFRELRLQAQQAAKERDELLAYVRQMEQQKKTQVEQVIEEEPDLNFDPEDIANGKQLNEMAKYVKNLKKQVQQTQIQSQEAKRLSYEAEVERNMRRLYPDFDAIVSADNIQKFREQYGPLANSIAADPDFYNKCNSVYLAIKNTGISRAATYQPQVDKVRQNMAKPRPLTSIAPQQAESPLARANAFAEGLTDDLQRQLIKEMNQARMKL